jgi:hypothetical protein
MGADLAINKLEAAAGIGNLFAEAGGELGEEVAVFACGGFGVAVQLGDFAGEQSVPLGIEGGYIALGVLDLARDAEKLGGNSFAGIGGVDLAVIVKETLQGFNVAAAVGLIGTGHQQSEVLLLGVVACEVGVYTLGDVAEEGLEAGRRIELFGFVGLTECGVVGFLSALAGLLGSPAGGLGVVQVDFARGNARFEVVELGIEDADLAEVTAFEGLQLGAEVGKFRFALGEHRADGSKLLTLIEEGCVVRGLLEDNFSWHTASHEGKF